MKSLFSSPITRGFPQFFCEKRSKSLDSAAPLLKNSAKNLVNVRNSRSSSLSTCVSQRKTQSLQDV